MNLGIRFSALIAAFIVAVVAVGGCTANVSNTTPSTSPMNLYQSPTGFIMQYPSDWMKYEPGNDSNVVVLFALPTNNETENLNVAVFDNPSDVNLTTLVANATHQIQQLDDFRQINASNTTLGGVPAYKVLYTASIGGSNLKIMQVWAINNGKSYDITYNAAPDNYDKYAGTVQQMIVSFRFK
jgi:eukaryotic-like serine/threonine-protein kinase